MRFRRVSVPQKRFRFIVVLALFNVLLLVLIFILFLPMLSNPIGLSVILPKAITSEPILGNGTALLILKDDSVYLGPRRVTMAQLEQLIASRQFNTQQVLIKVDRKASVGALVGVWDLVRRSGALKVSIATNE